MYAALLSAALTLSTFIGPGCVGCSVIWTFEPPEPGLDEAGGWYHSLVNSGLAIDGSQGSTSGLNALVLTFDRRPFRWGAAGAGVIVGVTPGMPTSLFTKVKADATIETITLRVQVYDFDAVNHYGPLLAEFSVAKSGLGAGWQSWVPGSFTPGQSLVIVEVVALGGATGTVGVWAVDDFSVIGSEEEDMTKRREIREAIVTRIGTVTTGNGYTLSVGEVTTGPTRMDDPGRLYPLVAVKHGEEVKTVHTLQRKSSVITFYVGVACQRTDSADPDDTADDLCGEIEKALELFGGGQWLGLGYVENVFVVGVDPEELTPEIARDMAAWTMAVEVTYTHDRRAP
jgi:hypothetical protein